MSEGLVRLRQVPSEPGCKPARSSAFTPATPDLHFTYAVVCIENPEPVTGECSLRVLWQQVWGGTEATDQAADYPLALGLANAGQARVATTMPVKNTYSWAVNALGIKAASRFQLPNLDTAEGGDAAGMGWLSPPELDAAQDLEDGAMYSDASQRAVLGRSKGVWMSFVQPDHVAYRPGSLDWSNGVARNLFYDDTSNHTVNLKTDLDEVPAGSMVRIFNMNPFGGSPYTIFVEVDSSSWLTIANSQMAEFLFWVDDNVDPAVGRWIAVQRTVFCSYKPTV